MQKVTTGKNLLFSIVGFFNHGFEFQDSVCNGCHDLTMLIIKISNIAIITVKSIDYSCITHNIRKSEAIYQKILLLKIVGILKKYCLNFLSIQGSVFLLLCLVSTKCLILWAFFKILVLEE